jgi:hypothetical protein
VETLVYSDVVINGVYVSWLNYNFPFSYHDEYLFADAQPSDYELILVKIEMNVVVVPVGVSRATWGELFLANH